MLQATKDIEERRLIHERQKQKHKKRQAKKRELPPEWLKMSRCGQWPPFLFVPKGVDWDRSAELFFGGLLGRVRQCVVFPGSIISEQGDFNIPNWIVSCTLRHLDYFCVVREEEVKVSSGTPFVYCMYSFFYSLRSSLNGSSTES